MNSITFYDEEYIPSKIVCVGRNYVEHIIELENEFPSEMVIFNKPNSAITTELFFISEDTRFEAEICFLIKNFSIEGVGFGLDLTKADLQNELKQKGLPWERAKAFNNSAVFGSFVEIPENITNLRLELFINEKLIQYATYDLMIYKPDEILRQVKSFMNLEDGDVIMSGTPKGVSTYSIGDIFIGKVFDGEKLLVESTFEVK